MTDKAGKDNSPKGERKKYLDTIVQKEMDIEAGYPSRPHSPSETSQVRPVKQTLRRRQEDQPRPPDHRAGQPSADGFRSPVHGSQSRRERDRDRQDDRK